MPPDPALDPINREIYRLRKQGDGWQDVADAVNKKYGLNGSSGKRPLNINSCLQRFLRNEKAIESTKQRDETRGRTRRSRRLASVQAEEERTYEVATELEDEEGNEVVVKYERSVEPTVPRTPENSARTTASQDDTPDTIMNQDSLTSGERAVLEAFDIVKADFWHSVARMVGFRKKTTITADEAREMYEQARLLGA